MKSKSLWCKSLLVIPQCVVSSCIEDKEIGLCTTFQKLELSVMVHTYNPNIWEAEGEGLLKVQDWSVIPREFHISLGYKLNATSNKQ